MFFPRLYRIPAAFADHQRQYLDACRRGACPVRIRLPRASDVIAFFRQFQSVVETWETKKTVGESNRRKRRNRRDGWQVLANGGIAALASIGFLWTEHTSFLVLFLIVLAASNADTWASEIGPLSKKDPFLLTGRRVPAGTSGAISILGTTATIVGALFIATAGDLLFDLSTDIWLLVTLGGIMGSLFDTLFGGTVQRKFRCVVCLKETEKRLHHNQPTLYIKGWKWLGNDGVNFLSSTSAGMIGFIVDRMW